MYRDIDFDATVTELVGIYGYAVTEHVGVVPVVSQYGSKPRS